MENDFIKYMSNPLNREFVRPELCKQLMNLGVTFQVFYFWQIKQKEVRIDTRIFDIDDYYAAAVKHINSINPVCEMLPAYTIADCEKCIRELNMRYILTFEKDEYYLTPMDAEMIREARPVKSNRMADVFAQFLINLIESNRINADEVSISMGFKLVEKA